jgi:hypothetical protein
MSFDRVFTILQESGPSAGEFQEIQPVTTDEKDMIHRIIKAHRSLMSLSDENRAKFENVIKVLEKQA